jgi:hypothetical protein
VFLEDWHWADDASRSVLEQVAELVSGYRLLIVVTSRSGYGVRWGTPGQHTAVPLRPLDASSLLALLKSILRVQSFPEDLGALFHQRTGGNPFFLEEICMALLKEGAIRIEGGEARPTGPLQLPPSTAHASPGVVCLMVWLTPCLRTSVAVAPSIQPLVAFSCKGRGVCPSCNARRMVEVAAHLTDHVLPPLPIRQWVLSLPKRIRPFLPHDPDLAGAVLRILLRAIRTALRRASPPSGPDAQLGAVSFLHPLRLRTQPALPLPCRSPRRRLLRERCKHRHLPRGDAPPPPTRTASSAPSSAASCVSFSDVGSLTTTPLTALSTRNAAWMQFQAALLFGSMPGVRLELTSRCRQQILSPARRMEKAAQSLRL